MSSQHPTGAFGCMSDACRSPLACASFGYCRGLNMVPFNRPICTLCLKRPDELAEYVEAASPEHWGGEGIHPDAYVRAEEGTYNPSNGHFLCTECYMKRGMPTAPGGWVAP